MLLDVPPRFLAPPSAASFAIGRKQVVSVDIADANPQHIVTASVIGLHLLQVAAPAPAAFSLAPHAASSAGGCWRTAGGGHQQHAPVAMLLCTGITIA